MRPFFFAGLLLASVAASTFGDQPPAPTMKVAMRTVDLNVGETQDVVFATGISLKETRDELRDAVRLAEATVEIDGLEHRA